MIAIGAAKTPIRLLYADFETNFLSTILNTKSREFKWFNAHPHPGLNLILAPVPRGENSLNKFTH
jgi:hypothetical protein